jgi:hypothetical protein
MIVNCHLCGAEITDRKVKNVKHTCFDCKEKRRKEYAILNAHKINEQQKVKRMQKQKSYTKSNVI